MKCWENASVSEKNQFQAISLFLKNSPHLFKFLFSPANPQLRKSPDDLLWDARGMCAGDYILLKLAIDLWCCSGNIRVHELFDVDPEVFANILEALSMLAPRHSALSLYFLKNSQTL